ncbi:MAG: MFS transporter, partial [Calditrichota bacterium]
MKNNRLNAAVFSLAFVAFFNVYLPQPVLPIIQSNFAASTILTALIISALFLGIAIGNLLFGIAVDRYAMRPIVIAGGGAIVLSAAICAVAPSLSSIIAARFIQGFFIPTISSCLAAYLARLLPREELNQILGGYVAATVAGGLGGRVVSG